jgi:Lrp/AsnC family transcriptional regulator for asnA, asnC and gidA
VSARRTSQAGRRRRPASGPDARASGPDARASGPDGPPLGRPAESEATRRELDELDRRIISRLQVDGRRSFRAIAHDLGVAESTVRFRAARLQQEGVLHIIALANPFRLGYAVQASVLITVTPAAHASVARTLAGWPEVMYLSSCAGSADLYMHIVCADHDQLWQLLGERLGAVEGVIGSQTLMELRVHKTRYVYPGLA